MGMDADSKGFILKYPINRPLTEVEIRNHLLQKTPSLSEPHYNLSIIRMNSTYLECVDKYFEEKGFATAVSSFMMCVLSILPSLFVIEAPKMLFDTSNPKWLEYTLSLLGVLVISVPTLIFFWKFLLSKEIYQYTHYPLRFNRKTRKVYIFRRDGTVMTEDWDKLYFTLSKNADWWSVHGHRLAEDGKTVLETFALPFSCLDGGLEDKRAWTQWEFVRRYMEDGPKKLVKQVEYVLDIAEQRETFYNGLQMLESGTSGLPVLSFGMRPFNFIFALARAFAIATSQIPQWPEEIERECPIDPDDPYIRDSKNTAVDLPSY